MHFSADMSFISDGAALHDALNKFLSENPTGMDRRTLMRYLESRPFRQSHAPLLPFDELERKLDAIRRIKAAFDNKYADVKEPFYRDRFAILLAAPLHALENALAERPEELVYYSLDFLRYCVYHIDPVAVCCNF